MKRVQVIFVAGMALPIVGITAGRYLADKQQTGTPSPEKPLPPRKHPAGDIPDSRVFIKYASSAGGYELFIPEGWRRKISGMDVSFMEKLDGFSEIVVHPYRAPGLERFRTNRAA